MIEKILDIQKEKSAKKKLETLKEITLYYKDSKFAEEFLRYIIYVYDPNIIFNIKLSTKEELKILNALDSKQDIDIQKIMTLLFVIRYKVVSRKTLEKYILNAVIYNKNKFTPSKEEMQLILLALKKNLGVGYKQIVKHIKPILKTYKIWDYLENYNKYEYIKNERKYGDLWEEINSEFYQLNPEEKRLILPYFPFSLADKHDKIEKIKNDYVLIQPKYDGFRAAISSNLKIYTRNHNIIDPEERPYLQNLIREIAILYDLYDEYTLLELGLPRPFSEEYIFDGEIFYKSFEETMSLASREEEKKDRPLEEYRDKLKFYIFDYIEKEGFENFDFKTKIINKVKQEERIKALQDFFEWAKTKYNFKQIELAPTIKVNNNLEEINQKMYEFVDSGYEGIIVKDPNKGYLYDRNQQWIKFKPVNEIEAIIVDVKEGEGEFLGKAGALIIKLPNGKLSSVGNLTKDLRDEIWQNKEEYIGMIVDVAYQEMTPDGVLRFPRIIRFREDKTKDQWNKEI